MLDFSIPGLEYTVYGDHFVFKGERYGSETQFRLNDEFYARNGIEVPSRCRYNPVVTFNSYASSDHTKWCCGHWWGPKKYYEIDPERDIWCIVHSVYYLTPDELMKQRLKDGSWMHYIGPQTLFYLFCLLISPLFKEWYLIWTIGLYIYLRTSYITLRKP